MRQVLAFCLAFSLSILVTWAGLHYDNALLYVGIGLTSFVLILFLWSWAYPKPAPIQVVHGPREPEPRDEKERALQAVKRARDNALIALSRKSEEQAERALHELRAAVLSVQSQFKTPPFNVSGAATYRELVRYLVRYVDSFYPLLREGHVTEGIRAARQFIENN